jgi:hypothetical protein
MPLYTFKSESGEVIEKVVPVGTSHLDMAGEKFSRTSEPPRVSYTGRAVGMPSQVEQVRGGYYKLECEHGTRFRSNFSKQTIKKAWGI